MPDDSSFLQGVGATLGVVSFAYTIYTASRQKKVKIYDKELLSTEALISDIRLRAIRYWSGSKRDTAAEDEIVIMLDDLAAKIESLAEWSIIKTSPNLAASIIRFRQSITSSTFKSVRWSPDLALCADIRRKSYDLLHRFLKEQM